MKDYSLRNEKSRIIQAMAISLHEIITELFENGYDQGYADAKSELGQNAIDLAHEESDRAYQQGVEDAWEAAKKLVLLPKDGGLECETIGNIFDGFTHYTVLKNVSASEAIANIKEYEEQQKQDTEIKVGDEVMTEIAEHGVAVRDTYYIGEDREPFTLIWFGTHMSSCPVNKLTKTGKHYPQIAEVLAEMRGESE